MFQFNKKHQKYEKYKSTNIDWIGNIPDGWDIIRAGHIFKEIIDKSENGDETLLSVSEYTGVSPRSGLIEEDEFLTRADSLEGYKKCRSGDLVMNIMLAWKTGLGVSNYEGIVSPAYSVYRPNNFTVPKYLHFLLRTRLYTSQFEKFSTGIISSRLRLYRNSFYPISVILPPKEEQLKIAIYLDEKTVILDEAITKKKNQIELLSEHRAAIINDTITKGLNKNIIMKDSGIEWIGMIPKEWAVKKIKYWTSNNANKAVFDNNCFIIALENIQSWTGKYILVEEDKIFEGDMNIFRKGDVLFGKLRPYLAKVYKTINDGLCGGEFLVLRPNKTIRQDFLYYRLISSDFITQVNNSTFGAKMPRADWGFIGNSKIPVPSLQEQTEIVSYLDKETKYIDDMIAKIEKSIELLEEYKTSLISHAVSGKIRVS